MRHEAHGKVGTRLGMAQGAALAALCAGVLGAGLWLGTQRTDAIAQQTPPSSATVTRVGLVDVAAVINGLTELNDRNNVLQATLNEYKKELEQLQVSIDSLRAELENTIPRTEIETIIAKRGELQERMGTYDLREKRYKSVLDLRRAAIIRDLYTKLQGAVASFAQREGYDLILLDDRAIPVPDNVSQDRLSEEIAKKRVLFGTPALDVTQRILAQMNNDYAAGSAGAGTGAPR